VTAAGLSDQDYRCLADFRHELRRFLAFSEARARAVGLNPQQHQLLLVVRASAPEGPSIGVLAERLVLRHHSVVELVDRLEGAGFIVRVRSEQDRRQVRVQLTPAGEGVLLELSVDHRDELRRAGPRLVRALSRVLEE